MIRTQIVLTPAESKKLISKAVSEMDVVQRALKEGIVAIHRAVLLISLWSISQEKGQKGSGLWG